MRIVAVAALAAMLCALTATASASVKVPQNVPTGDEARQDLRYVLFAFEQGVRVNAFGQIVASDISDGGGPPVKQVDYKWQAMKRGVVYVVEYMPHKGLLYLLERDRRGRAHTLFVDALGSITLR